VSKIKDLGKSHVENAEVKSWTCASCDKMVETEWVYCRSCAMYWADVDAGLFDEEYHRCCECNKLARHCRCEQ